jgi:hypothetical protein
MSIGEQNIVELNTYNQGEYPYGKRPTKREHINYKLHIFYLGVKRKNAKPSVQHRLPDQLQVNPF